MNEIKLVISNSVLIGKRSFDKSLFKHVNWVGRFNIITDATPKLYPSVGEWPLTDSSMASRNVQLTTLSRTSRVVALFRVVKNNRDFL